MCLCICCYWKSRDCFTVLSSATIKAQWCVITEVTVTCLPAIVNGSEKLQQAIKTGWMHKGS